MDTASKKLWDIKKVYMNSTTSRLKPKKPKNLEEEIN